MSVPKPPGDPDRWGDKGHWSKAERAWLNENVHLVCEHPTDVRLVAGKGGWDCPHFCNHKANTRRWRVS